MNKALAATAIGLALSIGNVRVPSADAQPVHAAAPVVEKSGEVVPARAPARHSQPPLQLWTDERDVRALIRHRGQVWAATGGGVVRYGENRGGRRVFGNVDGLDTVDVLGMHIENDALVADTALSQCTLEGDRFRCRAGTPRKPTPVPSEALAGHAVSARLAVDKGTFVATRGGGTFFVPKDGAAISLDAAAPRPPSFVRTAAVFRGALMLGSFRDGITRLPLDASSKLSLDAVARAETVPTPFRFVNDLAVVDGALFVAANEGLFVTRDAAQWTAVPAIGVRGITGLAADKGGIWVASVDALFRIERHGRGRARATFVRPGGSRSIQGVVSDAMGGAWIATEDRGAVHFDGASFRAHDRLAGLPTSWVVAIGADASGAALASTLRDGVLRVAPDGSWSRVALPFGSWSLTASRLDDARVCVGAQDGAGCFDRTDTNTIDDAVVFAGLPDPRVHLVRKVGDRILVGTEAGVAIYAANTQ